MQKLRVESREDFIGFLESLRSDLSANPDVWENTDLPSFLKAIQAWTIDMDGYYRNIGQRPTSEASWQVFADILSAAAIYE